MGGGGMGGGDLRPPSPVTLIRKSHELTVVRLVAHRLH